MKLNDAGLQMIMKHEGLRLKAYICPAGKPTIGYGHTSDVTFDHVREGRTITEHQAEVLLTFDLEESERIVSRAVTRKINENQFAALVSFVFNVGPGKKGAKDGLCELKSGRASTLLLMTNAGHFHTAAAEFAKWANANGKPLPGLVKRRADEAALFLRPLNEA